MPSKQTAVADALSRRPLPSTACRESAGFKVDERLVDCYKEISLAARVDPVLSRVLNCVRSDWPQHFEDLRRHYELSIEQDCLLWGIRRTRYWKNYMWVIQASSV